MSVIFKYRRYTKEKGRLDSHPSVPCMLMFYLLQIRPWFTRLSFK